MTTTNGSPSSTSSATMSSSSEANNPGRNPIPNPNPNPGSSSSNTMQSWWESVSKAQSRIHALSSLLASPNLITLAESDRPARSLLNSSEAYLAVSAALSHTSSGSGDDPLCQWLYETYQSSDPDLCLVVLSFVPLLSGLYLSRVVTFSVSSASGSAPSLAGFEAVLLALYGSEVKARSGKPLLITVQDPSQPSLYHTPPKGSASSHKPTIGVLSPPLEPQVAVKSTKRACIVGIALDCYYKKISLMPPCSKIDLCEFVSSWAGQDCPCRYEFDDDVDFSSLPEMRNSGEDDGGFENASEEMGKLSIQDRLNRECNWEGDESTSRRGSRVPLPWELLQPVLRILGHCLLAPLIPQEVRDSASAAVRCVYARASHDITPQVILAARSLIQLDKSTRKNAKDALMFAAPGPTSNPSTPNKPRKPEDMDHTDLLKDCLFLMVISSGSDSHLVCPNTHKRTYFALHPWLARSRIPPVFSHQAVWNSPFCFRLSRHAITLHAAFRITNIDMILHGELLSFILTPPASVILLFNYYDSSL